MSQRSSVHITRRAAVGAMAAAGVGFALFGPDGRDEKARAAARQGRLILDYWEKWTGLEGDAMQKVVDEFNASQSRLFVRYLVTGTIHQKALVAIAGGDAPDIIGMYAFNVPTYAEANAAMPLDELAKAAGLSLETYAAGMRKVMTHGGKWWGVVNTGGTLALYYNKSAFREVGLDPERPPRTVQQWDAACARFVRRESSSGSGGELLRVGHLHPEPGWWSWIWGYHFGGGLWDPTTDHCTADAPANIAAYEWVQRTSRELGVESVEKFRSGLGKYGQSNQAFLTGQVAMVVQGPWLANQIKAFAPTLDYGVTPVPVDEAIYDPAAPVALVDTDVLMIPRGCRNPEASMEFVAYTQRPEIVERLATVHGKGSPLAKASESFIRNHPNRGVALHTALADSPRAFIAPPTPAWAEMKDNFDTAADSIWKGTARVPERLRLVRERCQQALDRHAAAAQRRGEKRQAQVEGGA